jgi:beta-lactam-binding protein with PASTA domain
VKKRSPALGIAFVLLFVITGGSGAATAAAANVKNGDSCSPTGVTYKQGSDLFVCTQSGTKSVWQKKIQPAPAPNTLLMPNLVGKNLQSAEDVLSSLGNTGSRGEDVSGQSRLVIIDGNWKVCRQSVASGKRVPVSTVIVLGAVKSAEVCRSASATFVMPNVVGMNLQSAEDLLQSLGNNTTTASDVSGEERWVIVQGNWKVCRQYPVARKKVPVLRAGVLNVVKLAEVCP